MVDDFIFRSFFLKIVEISLLIILNVLFLIGNILVCILVYKNNRFCIIMNLYIIVLVVSDLFFVVFVMFFGIGVLIISEWSFGEVFCQFYVFFSFFVIYVFFVIMGLIVVNRYVRMCKFD